MKIVFLRALEADDKAAALLAAIRDPESARGRQRFEVDAASFTAVPGSAFIYRTPKRMLALAAGGSTLAVVGAKAKQGFGASTRFHRLAWEVDPRDVGTGRRWLWLAHGTKPAPFYKPTFHVALWRDGGREAKADVLTRYPYLNGNYGFKIQAEEDYGRPGLCYGKRTGLFTVQVLPPGHAFSFEGTAIHIDEPSVNIWSLLALLNSRPVAFWLNDVCAQHKTYSYVDALPVPGNLDDALGFLARRGWQLQFQLRQSAETNNHFTLPALLLAEGDTLGARSEAWAERADVVDAELAAIQTEIDERCFNLYSIDDAERRTMTEGFGAGASENEDAGDAEYDANEDGDESLSTADATSLAAELVSWTVGVAFGRFDVRLATKARPLPVEPEPFDPLPACSAGMLTGDDGMPLPHAPTGYPLAFPDTGVLVDDPGHAQNLTAATRSVFDVVFGADADRWWQEVAAMLDPKAHDLRAWLAGGLFEHHLKRHSKSHRKAPIVWQLGTPSGRYSVWLYAHRLTRDSFFQLQNEVAGPKLTHEERQLASLMQNAGGSPSAADRKEIASQEAVVEELRTMLDEVKRVAPLWNPNLDDGVVLTMAPLWRLVPQHKAWQKELKAKWDELSAGKYDWAHLAMHLWPERVVPKCATDRSLAIAHGLEDVFWADGTAGKWQQRPVPTRSVDELVRERTSPSVKAALKSLLDAHVGASNGRGRGRRSATAAATGGNA